MLQLKMSKLLRVVLAPAFISLLVFRDRSYLVFSPLSSPKKQTCSFDHISVCQSSDNANRTFLYIMWNRAGFSSELNQVLLGFAYSVASRRHFLIDSRRWNYGNFNKYFHFQSNRSYFQLNYTFLNENNFENDQIQHLKTTRIGLQIKKFWRATQHVQSIALKRRVAHYLWQTMTKETSVFIKKYIISNMSNYIGVHVRRGDKLVKEARPVPLQKYIHTIERKMLMKNTSRNIFVSSDDPSVIEGFRQLKPAWNFFCIHNDYHNRTQRHSHDQSDFNRLSAKEKNYQTRCFMCELQMLASAKYVLCSMSSNVCRLTQVLRYQHPSTAISLDRSWYGI